MRRLVISVRNFILADAIAEALNTHSDYDVFNAEDPQKAIDLCRLALPNALLLEVCDCNGWRPDDMKPIRDMARKQVPDCKIVLLIDEKGSKGIVDQVMQLKKDNMIDNFIFSSVSSSYLVAMMDAL